jgi:hypothetical protein
MPSPNGQGPLNDPRLVERRGDLSGLNAALFVVLVVAAFGVAAYLLANYATLGAPAVTASPNATLAPSRPPGSAQPTATGSAPPTVMPTPSPRSTSIRSARVGRAVPLQQAGVGVGDVTVVSVDSPAQVAGQDPGGGMRWLVARIRYRATAPMRYDAATWYAVDPAGVRYPWAGQDPRPPLKSGTLKAGAERSGNVSFDVPADLGMTLLLTDASGAEVLEVILP